MISAIIILVAVAVWGLVHSWLASLGLKARLRQRNAQLVERYYRLAYNLFAFITLLPVFALVRLLPDRSLYVVHLPWALLLLALEAAAGLMLLLGVLQTGAGGFIGIQQAFGRVENGPHHLVTGGLYRWVRHPLYLAGMVFIWATPIMTRNLLVLYIAFTLYLIFGALVEECKLLAEFGQEYAAYRQRTPMFFPWPRPQG
jgi:protein-S-isoprenylcysteine O-methyltransferase Ste14